MTQPTDRRVGEAHAQVTSAGGALPPAGASSVDALVLRLLRGAADQRAQFQDQLGRALSDPHQRLGAVLFVEVCDAARFFQVHGDDAGQRMLVRANDLLLPVIDRCGGRILEGGREAALALFPNAANAVDAAVAMQQAVSEVHAKVTQDEDRVRIRIGVHFGAVRSGAGEVDPLQASLSVAAAVHGHAAAMQILVSDTVRAQLPSTMPLNKVTVPSGGGQQSLVLHEVAWRQMSRPHDDLPRIDPRYAVQSKLGAGGMASVWRARDERLGRDVAIKVLHRNLPFSSSMRERLQREARVAAALSHENIVQVYDVAAPEAGDSYIAMELVEGRTLRDCVEKLGALPSFPATLIAYEVARGVGFAHARGVVHRDVKPDNVLISDRGAVKVGDFGIAVMDELVRLTASGVPVGTPAYLSPEQVKGERADSRSDVFAFGVMLYEVATGKLPFSGASPSALMYKIVEGDYVPAETQAQLEPELAQVIRRCLKRNPADRYQNITEIVDVFRPLLQRWSVVDPRSTLAAYVTEGNLRRSAGDSNADKVPTLATPRLTRRPLRKVAMVAVPALALVAGGVFAARSVGEPAASEAAVPVPLTVAAPVVASPVAAPPEAEKVAVPIASAVPTAVEPVKSPAAKRPRRAEPARSVEPAVATQPGTLQVILQGAWADIVVDGKPKGRSPPLRSLSLAPGEHVIELRNPHRALYRQTVRIESGGSQVLRAELEPLP